MHWRPQLQLPLTLVVVGPDRNLNTLPQVFKAGENSMFFWGLLDIKLRPHVVGLQSAFVPIGPYLDGLRQLHHWELWPRGLAIYIWPALNRVGINAAYLGEAFTPLGFAVAAGNVLIPGGESMLDEIIDHELGHLLGLEHEEGTFMGSVIEMHNRHVTRRQGGVMREAVKRL